MDSAEQQIVDGINGTSNILVTVSNNPSVDELSAALGLTLLLDKLDKRATAIFSGGIPPAITFLEPEKTFEGTADSLRDFIIALNKEKADHLRYKVDGDVVKIFITPYKTKLTQGDLEFSDGDYNVETVIALGVTDQDHLDGALAAHGKILHDSKVLTITAGVNKSTLGSIDWHNDNASSLSEMISSMVPVLSTEPILDEQISTALLTGIVSATDRFSNDKTTSQVMTISAQLMAAGANQQLIASKLQEGHALAPTPIANGGQPDTGVSSDGTELVIERTEPQTAPTAGEKVIEPPAEEPKPAVSTLSNEDSDQLELEKQLAGLTAPSTGTMADIEKELQEAAGQQNDAVVADATLATVPSDTAMPDFEATSPVAVQPAVLPQTPPSAESVAPATDFAIPGIVSDHAPVGILPPDQMPAMNGTLAGDDEEKTIDPFSGPQSPSEESTSLTPDPMAGTPEGAAILATPPESVAAIAPPEFSLPTPPSLPSLDAVAPPVIETTPVQSAIPDIPELPPLPPLPPLPMDGSATPLPPPPPPPAFDPGAAQAGAVSGDVFGDAGAMTPEIPAAPVAPSPGQFKIPGQ